MIETSFVIVSSDGKQVEVRWMDNGETLEGPATFPARYSSLAGIISYCDTQLGPSRRLTLAQRESIQALLGSPWPAINKLFKWADAEVLE